MAQMGLKEQAKRLWLEALPTGFIEWHEDRQWLLVNLGKALTQSHQFEQAEAIIQMIEDAYYKEDVLVQLGMKLAQAHHWAKATKVAYSIESNIWKKEAILAELGKIMAQAKLWEKAEEMLLTHIPQFAFAIFAKSLVKRFPR